MLINVLNRLTHTASKGDSDTQVRIRVALVSHLFVTALFLKKKHPLQKVFFSSKVNLWCVQWRVRELWEIINHPFMETALLMFPFRICKCDSFQMSWPHGGLSLDLYSSFFREQKGCTDRRICTASSNLNLRKGSLKDDSNNCFRRRLAFIRPG